MAIYDEHEVISIYDAIESIYFCLDCVKDYKGQITFDGDCSLLLLHPDYWEENRIGFIDDHAYYEGVVIVCHKCSKLLWPKTSEFIDEATEIREEVSSNPS